MDQPAYRLAVQVCNATADKLQRYVCAYFTEIIVNHSQDEDFDEIRTVHELIKQVNRSCPSILHSVVPQLEEELRADKVELRQIVTQVLGDMFSDKGGAYLVKKYPSTWNVWLNRRNDKTASIRITFVEATRGLLVNMPEVREVVEGLLMSPSLFGNMMNLGSQMP
jgi:sister chromatid cohesion protein PDS5